ncbi:hypothetical protein ABTY20_23090 [Streptomyces sp. NPDC126497]|uniref:hypothetical protein n=1 Tax=Streptomyces sp. NPDC126497 TaxID=3155313 RepID=UPI0033294AC5
MTTTEPRTPDQLADAAAEAVRALAHATLSRPAAGWQYPDEARNVVANLAILAERLPQALGQVESFIGAHEDAGRLRSEHGPDDLAQRLLAFHGAVAGAIRHARALEAALGRAHQSLGAVSSTE